MFSYFYIIFIQDQLKNVPSTKKDSLSNSVEDFLLDSDEENLSRDVEENLLDAVHSEGTVVEGNGDEGIGEEECQCLKISLDGCFDILCDNQFYRVGAYCTLELYRVGAY